MRPSRDGGSVAIFFAKTDLVASNAVARMPIKVTWDKRAQAWLAPMSKETLPELQKLNRMWQFDDDGAIPELKKWIAARDRPKNFKLLKPQSKSGWPYGAHDYQTGAAERLLEFEKAWLADDVGTGKTVTALAAVKKKSLYPLVVVCPASLIWNWQREVKTWLKKEAHVVTGKSFAKDAEVYIVSYDSLFKNTGNLITRKPECLIFDEVHALKDGQSRRSQTCLKLADKTRARYRFGLSATPMPNRPIELVSQARVLGVLGTLGGYEEFVRNFVGERNVRTRGGGSAVDLTGSRNLEKLNKLLYSTCMIRRERKIVQPQMPKLVTKTIPVEVDQKYFDLSADVIAEIESDPSSSGVPQMNRLLEAAARAKLKSVYEWVDARMSIGRKILIYTQHLSVVRALEKRYAGKCVKVTGSTSVKTGERQAAVDRFQNEEGIRIFIGTKAAQEGFTLTAGDKVVFVDPGWTPMYHDQVIGRCFGRASDPHGATAVWFVGKRTIDEIVMETLDTKRKVTNAAITEGDVEKDVQRLVLMKLKKGARK